MNILILHRIPYYKIEYHRGIDHSRHNVFYIGTKENLNNIPSHVFCKKIIRSGIHDVVREVSGYLRLSAVKFDKIISMSEYELLAAAQLRELFHIDGPLVSDVELVRNKLLMKKSMAEHGIRVPTFTSMIDLIEKEYFSSNGKLVLKPISGASSENVVVFSHYIELLKRLKNGNTGVSELDGGVDCFDQYEVEEFIEGDIIHIDGLVQEGRIIKCLASQYIGTCLNYANGFPLGSIQIETTSLLKNWAQKCILAAKINSGSFHLELIKSPDGLVFLEIANRVGGADVVKTFELATGVHLPSAELKLQLSEYQHMNDSNLSNKKYGWFVFPGHKLAACVASMLNSEEFKNHKFIIDWHELPRDKKCKSYITYQPNEVPLAGVICGDDSNELIQFMQRMFASIKITDSHHESHRVA
ncbi:MAG: ATP-grasp domain-containing protein [Gammaproteobacteria bacterium]|nr:ATP-grasp domain-containing protein [Gammaproteobacteria bacterium]